jgi:hypothetical protein
VEVILKETNNPFTKQHTSKQHIKKAPFGAFLFYLLYRFKIAQLFNYTAKAIVLDVYHVFVSVYKSKILIGIKG